MATDSSETSAARKWVASIASGLGGVLFGLAVAALVLTLLVTRFFDYAVLTINSGSMTPTIHKGDIVVVRPESIDKLKTNDIIYFKEKNTGVPFVHRIAGVQRQIINLVNETNTPIGQRVDYNIVTKGDANPSNDSEGVARENYKGIYWFHVPTHVVPGIANVGPSFLLLIVTALLGLGWGVWELYSRRGGRSSGGSTGGGGGGTPRKKPGLRKTAAGRSFDTAGTGER